MMSTHHLAWRNLTITFLHAVTFQGKFYHVICFYFLCFWHCFPCSFCTWFLNCILHFSATKLRRMISLFMQLSQRLHQLSMLMCLVGTVTSMHSWGSRKFLSWTCSMIFVCPLFPCIRLELLRSFGLLYY